jgi:Putative binding domain, N-terminal/Viral BACON domain
MKISGRQYVQLAVGFVVMGLAVLQPLRVMAQGCFDHVLDINYSPANCSAQPSIDRVFRLQQIRWKGHDYLFVDEGNEIKIFNIDNPLNPIVETTSVFDIPNLGDSDYDLVNFSVCDDCRWGIANYKVATVLFDLGTGPTPVFADSSADFDASLILGGFTFEFEAQQYLIASSLGSNPCSASKSGLYAFYGVNEAGNPLLQCLENGGVGLEVVNGIMLAGGEPNVIYLSERFDQFRIFQVRTSPTFGLDYLGNGGISRANMFRGYGAAVDEDEGILAVADMGRLSIYDIGFQTGSPASPVQLSSILVPAQPNANAVALAYPVVHVAQQYTTTAPLTFNISVPTNPIPLDQSFWDPSLPWNNLGSCMWNNHAVFSPGGGAMYLSRYSALQVIGTESCRVPEADFSLDPQPVFPGDLVSLTNTSAGGDRYAAWVTDGPDPHGGTILAGSLSFSSGTVLGYTVPTDPAAADEIWAHAAVENTLFPYFPGGPPSQIKSMEIAVDRRPGATISLLPQVAVTGDTVSLVADAEGYPAVPGGGDPYAWTVTDPSGGQSSAAGSPSGGVVLNEGGDWIFDLEVSYQHEDPDQAGTSYVSTTRLTRTISSVSAAFDVSPPVPVHSETMTLVSVSAAQGGAVLDLDWDVMTWGGVVVHELSFCDGPGPVDDECVIPAETLAPGIYDIRLTLTNTNNSDEDVVVLEDLEVHDGHPELDFAWNPTSPEIGQWVAFQITGIGAADIGRSVWSFGGQGCDASTTYTCIEPSFPGCDRAAFAYAGGGAKTVHVTVTTSVGVELPAVQHTLTVEPTGSCESSSCTYAVSPASKSFTSSGGYAIISIETQPGCDWSVWEDSSWLSITSASTGTGSGTFNYNVALNHGASRSTYLSVAGETHLALQASGNGCAVSIEPAAGSYPWQGGGETIAISTALNCPWEASSPEPWITLTSPASGIGSGELTYTVAENEGAARSGSVLIGNQVHAVSQNLAGPCSQGAVFDDGSVENGYGWGTGFVFVQEFTPGQYPYVYSDVCIGFTRSEGDPTLIFHVLVFDDNGSGNGPGTLLGATSAVIDDVAAWLDHTMASVNIVDQGVVVDEGSVFIGVGWHQNTEIGFHVAADESPATPGHSGYFSADGATWQPISTTFPSFRSLMVRADGLSPVDGEWRQVVGSVHGGGSGFGDSLNLAATSMATFGSALFVGTENPFGAEVNYSFDGQTWFLGNNPGFNEPTNDDITGLVPFAGHLYAATRNRSLGAQVWRTALPLGWSSVEGDGFGDPANTAAPSSAVYDGEVYFGTDNPTGCEIWRSSDGVAWAQVNTDGFGEAQNQVAETMDVFADELFVGTRNVTGAELWKTADGETWSPVMTGGFGSPENEAITDLAVYQNQLYAGVANGAGGAQIWRSLDGASWAQIVGDGFGDQGNTDFDGFVVGELGLLAAVSGPTRPATFWLSATGASWAPNSSPGFSNQDNASIEALYNWDDRIFAGTANTATGCEIWRAGRHPLFEDGFESGDSSSWTWTEP